MAELRNCIRCGKLFAYTYIYAINALKEDEDFKVKNLNEYPGSTAFEVSEVTEYRWKNNEVLREERLELSDDNKNLLLQCESWETY